MDEGKQSKAGAGDDTSAQNAARHDEATSSETLSDMKQTQPAPAQGETSGASRDSNSAPAPDGTPDTARGSNSGDGRDSGGPM